MTEELAMLSKIVYRDTIRDSAVDGGIDGMRAKYCLQRRKCDEDDNAGVDHSLRR